LWRAQRQDGARQAPDGPALYYPELVGVRLEDVACVSGNRPRNLANFEKVFEI
jgi:hypothetical protein